jgi:transglutaminase-like putative cysteine protease
VSISTGGTGRGDGGTVTDAGPGLAGLVDLDPVRLLALASVAALLGTFLSVLYRVSDVAGDVSLFLTVAAGTLLVATVVARFVPERVAVVLAAVLLAAGTYVYVTRLPRDVAALPTLVLLLADGIELLTGLSVLRIVNVGLWALAATPAPAFVAWYLALRRRYVASVLVGGAMLTLFILTGDASGALALLGVVAAAGAVGFGDLERRGGDLAGAEAVAVVLAVMVTAALLVSVVPTSGADPLDLGPGGGDGTVESSLTSAGDSVEVLGSIRLSPEVRFTVRSEEPSYWRVGSYDRYTGGGWVRTGSDRSFDGRLPSPVGRSRTVRQRYTVESDLRVLPAAWKPTEVSGEPISIVELPGGGLAPDGQLTRGDTYSVESERPVASARELRGAGTDYPAPLQERYTQLPDTTPDRVAERTARITANAQSPYDTARVIERWLENNREYSLTVDRPRGDIADAFLFEMERGYCTYYATTMVTMLRTQGIPARLAVGYTPGQQVTNDKWVARGLDSHAWVEVYFPDHGWIRFDPTPAAPRESAERQRIQQARQSGTAGQVDTNESRNQTFTPTPTPTPATPTPASPSTGTTPTPTPTPTPADPDGTVTGPNATSPGPGFGDGADIASPGGGGDEDEGGGLPRPTREQTVLGLVVLVGAAAGLHRSGAGSRLYREARLRYQPRTGDPARDVARAFGRLEYLAEKAGEPRQPGETARGFAVRVGARGRPDERARELAGLHERARYGDGVTAAEADEAVALADELVSDRPRITQRR